MFDVPFWGIIQEPVCMVDSLDICWTRMLDSMLDSFPASRDRYPSNRSIVIPGLSCSQLGLPMRWVQTQLGFNESFPLAHIPVCFLSGWRNGSHRSWRSAGNTILKHMAGYPVTELSKISRSCRVHRVSAEANRRPDGHCNWRYTTILPMSVAADHENWLGSTNVFDLTCIWATELVMFLAQWNVGEWR